ncbi:hypothetical protein JHFBIEKO_3085 [Methylobacterium mesophilicum]|nr:hypothetical protein JHFBIEKO_3085 [Methylobacterium mesophilicum]
MPQTLAGWILIAAVLLSGAGGGFMASRMLTAARDGREIDRRDVVAAAIFCVGLVASAALLVWVEGR